MSASCCSFGILSPIFQAPLSICVRIKPIVKSTSDIRGAWGRGDEAGMVSELLDAAD
jgi:hypothetical protein